MHFYLHIIWFLDNPTLGVPSFDLSCGPRVKPCWIFWWNSSVGFKRVQNHHYWNAAPGKPGGYSPCNAWRRNCAGRIRRQLAAHHHTSPIFSACTDERNLRLGGGQSNQKSKSSWPNTQIDTHIFRNVQLTHAVRGSNHMFRIQTKKNEVIEVLMGMDDPFNAWKINLAPRSHWSNVVIRKSPQVEGRFGSQTLVFIMSTPEKCCHLGSLSVFWQETSKINKTRPISFFRCFNLFALFISFTVCFRMQQRMTAHDGLSPWLDSVTQSWFRSEPQFTEEGLCFNLGHAVQDIPTTSAQGLCILVCHLSSTVKLEDLISISIKHG